VTNKSPASNISQNTQKTDMFKALGMCFILKARLTQSVDNFVETYTGYDWLALFLI